MADDEYDEYEAVVRIPKGERLADSRKTEGWSRGFTPKSSDKGPEHVEIRLKDEGEVSPAQEPDVIHVTEHAEPPRQRELTAGQQLVADFLKEVLDGVIEATKPYVLEWWDTRVVPAMVAKRDNFLQRRQARKAEEKALRSKATVTTSASEEAVEDEGPSQQVAVAEGTTITMTSEQFQQIFMTWLAREDAQQALWDAIVNAEIKDEDAATLEWRQRLQELTPEQRTERVMEILSTNPSILADLGRHLMTPGPLELGETIRRQGGS